MVFCSQSQSMIYFEDDHIFIHMASKYKIKNIEEVQQKKERLLNFAIIVRSYSKILFNLGKIFETNLRKIVSHFPRPLKKHLIPSKNSVLDFSGFNLIIAIDSPARSDSILCAQDFGSEIACFGDFLILELMRDNSNFDSKLILNCVRSFDWIYFSPSFYSRLPHILSAQVLEVLALRHVQIEFISELTVIRDLRNDLRLFQNDRCVVILEANGGDSSSAPNTIRDRLDNHDDYLAYVNMEPIFSSANFLHSDDERVFYVDDIKVSELIGYLSTADAIIVTESNFFRTDQLLFILYLHWIHGVELINMADARLMALIDE